MIRRIALGALFALVATLLAVSAGQSTLTAATPGIDTTDRAEVAQTYLASIAAARTVHDGWSGAVEDCVPGSPSAEFQSATLGAANWFRAMAGLDPITLNPAASDRAQSAALMMHAQGALSHSPGTSLSLIHI